MLRLRHKKVLCRMLAVAVAATSIFATSPVTQAKTTKVTTEAAQVAAEDQIIIHAKGTGLNIYVWKGETKLNGDWPGNAMEADATMGSGWCYAAIPADCDGFIICQGSNKLTDDVKDKKAGEYWFVDGTFLTTNPEGPTPTPTEAPTPTPAPIEISSITPADGSKLKAGVEQQISVNASTTIDDGTLYYKYEVKCGGEYVGDHYYSKSNTYNFTPEDGKKYTVKISVQAHDEDNTTVSQEVAYTGSSDGEEATPGPDNTPAPPSTPPSDIPTPGANTPEPSDPTNTPDAGTPGPSDPTKTPEAPGDETPVPSTVPTETPKTPATKTPTPPATKTPVPQVTNTPTPTSGNSGFDDDYDFTATLKTNVKSPQKAGASIKLTASASHGSGGYKYKFSCKKSGGSKVTLKGYSSSKTYTWKPTENGTYTLYVDVKDSDNMVASAKISNFKVKGLTVTVTLNKKSPQKKNTVIKISAKAANPGGKATYRFIVKQGSKTVNDTKKYKSSSTYKWKPKKKGTYTLYVKVKGKYTTVTKKTTFKIK